MADANRKNLERLKEFIAKSGDTYVFDDETSVGGFGALFGIINDMGLDPMKTADLKKAVMTLFNIELINMPDLEQNRFIFTPNHVSDMDALVLGLVHPKIRIVAKSGWINNEKLRQFLDIHYDLCGIDRASVESLRGLLSESIKYFNDSDECRHYLVFSQGTISDFNHNSPERISRIAHTISMKTGVPIVNVFIEQVSLYHPTRIVFDNPMQLCKKDDFRTIWLEREAAMQNALVPPARSPKLTHKHANNNKPGDPFF